jgi:hypothetical protein
MSLHRDYALVEQSPVEDMMTNIDTKLGIHSIQRSWSWRWIHHSCRPFQQLCIQLFPLELALQSISYISSHSRRAPSAWCWHCHSIVLTLLLSFRWMFVLSMTIGRLKVLQNLTALLTRSYYCCTWTPLYIKIMHDVLAKQVYTMKRHQSSSWSKYVDLDLINSDFQLVQPWLSYYLSNFDLGPDKLHLQVPVMPGPASSWLSNADLSTKTNNNVKYNMFRDGLWFVLRASNFGQF